MITNQLVGGCVTSPRGLVPEGNRAEETHFPCTSVLHPSPAEYSGSLSKSWFLTLALKEIIWRVYKKRFKLEPLDPPILI